MLTRVSMRASGPPGQLWTPRPKARCSRALPRSTRNSAGSSKRRGSRLAAPLSTIRVAPAGMSTPATVVRPPGEPEVAFDRGLDAERLLDEVRDELTPLPEELLQVRTLADELQGGAEQPHRRLLSGGEEVGGDADHVDDLGQLAVGERRGGQRREHVVARLAPAVLDVAAEAVVEPLQRAVRHRCPSCCRRRCCRGRRANAVAELVVLVLRDTQEVGDDEQGERVGVVADELALAARDELVDLAVGEPPHELLVLLQPLRA